MDQKITFEDGKLVILTDNGKICGDETTTKLAGTFTVNAGDAEFIRKLIDNKRYTMISTTEYSQDDGSKRSHIFRSVKTSDDAIAEEFGNIKDQLNTDFEWKLSRTYRWLIWGAGRLRSLLPDQRHSRIHLLPPLVRRYSGVLLRGGDRLFHLYVAPRQQECSQIEEGL